MMTVKAQFFALTLLTTAALPTAFAAEPDGDLRHRLGMTPAERGEFLNEMRQMLTSIQGIIAGIGSEDRERIAEAARYSGNRMARATPDSLRQRLPGEFQEIGGPTHMLFEEIAIRAETDDMADLAVLTGQTLQQCLACHAMFRAD
jgi:cytochrome c556